MHRLWWLIFTLCTCRASEGLEPSSDEALRVTPSALDFAPSIVGTRKTMVITVQNPTRVTRTVDTRTSAPFEVAEHLEIGGGASVELVVTFAPTEVVRSDAVISIGEHQVSVTGSGVAVPTCAAPTFCSTERFDFRTETCVEDRAPDGTDCTASNACFASALCERGECVSVSTTCDDGEPCTTDFCTATGCTHTPAACPVTDSLCEAPVCINGVGCSTAPVPDGTSCGRRTCDDARVCINARCTSRPVPIGQTCVDVMAGQAAGCGHLDGPADEARLRSVKSGAFDLEGTLYFADGQTIRRLSRNGLVHTLAGAPEETGFVDGPGAFARFTDPTILGIDAQGNIITIEASWRLRRVTPAGFVTTWALAPTTEHWAVMATLEVSGEVTVWTGPGSTLFRVSRSGRVTQQIAKPPPSLSACVPTRVKLEVQRYLDCGQLRCGFVEVTCASCSESRLIAFSCKGRGWCPSCTARRAAETGLNLANVLPRVTHRQWTLSLPFIVRLAVVKEPRLLKCLERRLVKSIWRWQRQQAKRAGHGVRYARGAGVCFTQWFGSRLQLTPHLHVLVPEALWSDTGVALDVEAPSEDDVATILHRTLRQARGDWGELEETWADDDFEVLQQQAIQGRLPMELPAAHHRRRRVAVAEGFSLHADTAVHANDRVGLERLCRYGARGPIAECRLRKLTGELYEYAPKRGVTFTLTAADLVRRLVALVPPAKSHLTSFHGVYAPHATLRGLVTATLSSPPPPAQKPPTSATSKPKTKRARLDWASLHQHTFGNDVLRCPCGGRRTIRALFSTHKAAEERLSELGRHLPSRLLPSATAPPQLTFAV